LRQCPCLSPEWENPAGVPISAIVFGGRRSTVMPLVFEAFDWQHGVYVGATMTSERTAAAAGKVGVLRHDPMAMLPFCGYHMGDYWQHWLDMESRAGARLPRVFHVNWFRKDARGRLLWPGYGENTRVLKWIVERCHHETGATTTPIGYLPRFNALDVMGLGLAAEALQALLTISPEKGAAEVLERDDWFGQFGDKLPAGIREEHEALRARLT
jgi:phosphoenolpyruvate carboxykinase (GTP)